MPKQVYYFINFIRSENGYATRVKAIYNILTSLGLTVKIVPLCYITPREVLRWLKQKFMKKRIDLFGLSNSYLVPIPSYNFIVLHLLKVFFNKKLNKVDKNTEVVYWAETYFPAHYAIALKNKNITKVVVDIHGAQGEELSEYSKMPVNKKLDRQVNLLDRIEKEIIKNSNTILTVSNQMVNHLVKKTGYTPDSSVLIPCFPDFKKFYPVQNKEEKIELRKKLNIPQDDLTFIYVGSLDQWQCINETILVFKQITKLMDSTFVMLTPNCAKAQEITCSVLNDKTIQSKIICKTVPHDEVRNYISASDIGFLLRKRSLTNIVSSPTKFAEYLACGIPVIATEFAGISGNIIESDKVGLIINLDDLNVPRLNEFINEVMKNDLYWSERCRNSAENNFDQKIYKERIKELLKL